MCYCFKVLLSLWDLQCYKFTIFFLRKLCDIFGATVFFAIHRTTRLDVNWDPREAVKVLHKTEVAALFTVRNVTVGAQYKIILKGFSQTAESD